MFQQLQILVLLVAMFQSEAATGGGRSSLPFDRSRISRYSVDGRPRSIAIRQGKDVWLAYDLEGAKPFKVWQAPAGNTGLTISGFTTRSRGMTWYEDRSGQEWQLRTARGPVGLEARYLGCTQRDGFFELRWELRHDVRVVALSERVFTGSPSGGARVIRELKTTGLADGEVVLPPGEIQRRWHMTTPAGHPAKAMGNGQWYRSALL